MDLLCLIWRVSVNGLGLVLMAISFQYFRIDGRIITYAKGVEDSN